MSDKTDPKFPHGVLGAAIPLYETEEERRARLAADHEAMRRFGEQLALERERRVIDAILGSGRSETEGRR